MPWYSRCRSRAAVALVLAPGLFCPLAAHASGHGPVYGLATPTLGEGAWSIDASVMGRLAPSGGGGVASMLMLRPMVSYGITEDLQVSASVPMPVLDTGTLTPARVMAMMPGELDAEALLAWRFARRDTSVGARLESTAYFGFDYPLDSSRGGVATNPGIVAGGVAGYASRSVYAWAGALYRRYMSPLGPDIDHVGDDLFYSVVLGYRPPFLRRDLPHPDWRLFVEAVGEWQQPDLADGHAVPSTGGNEIFVGPTVLGLFGAWGISGGPLFAVSQRLEGSQRGDWCRMAINYSYWFF